jgi:hypothetical protein
MGGGINKGRKQNRKINNYSVAHGQKTIGAEQKLSRAK